ncbi:MAG: hypothetical protein JSU06_16585 [Actinobacteria bacterium]|nr:hypothetical protein [Actinomycetota bacterium]
MTPPKRVAIHPVAVDLPRPQIEILKEEIGNALSVLAQDLAYLDRNPHPERAVSEVAAHARLTAALSSGNLLLPDRGARKPLHRLAEEVDERNEYERAVAGHEAFRAFERLLRTPPPASGSSKGLS